MSFTLDDCEGGFHKSSFMTTKNAPFTKTHTKKPNETNKHHNKKPGTIFDSSLVGEWDLCHIYGTKPITVNAPIW